MHALGNTAALAPGGPPLVLMVHDLIWRAHPETHAGLLAKGLSVLGAAGRAQGGRDHHADARSTAADLERLPRRPGREDHGRSRQARGRTTEACTPEPELRARLGLGDGPLVLCPAPRRPHKNVARLVAATAGLGATVVVPGYASIEDA